MKLLCRVGLHRWRTTKVESNLYGVILRQRCMRRKCTAIRTGAVY